MLHDVVVVIVVGRTPAIHACIYVHHDEKRDAWFSVSMHACGSVFMLYVMVLRKKKRVKVTLRLVKHATNMFLNATFFFLLTGLEKRPHLCQQP